MSPPPMACTAMPSFEHISDASPVVRNFSPFRSSTDSIGSRNQPCHWGPELPQRKGFSPKRPYISS